MGGMTFSKLAIFWVILLINRKEFNFLREGSLYLFGQLLRKWWVTYERDSYTNVSILYQLISLFYIQLHCKPTQTLRKKLNWLTHFFLRIFVEKTIALATCQLIVLPHLPPNARKNRICLMEWQKVCVYDSNELFPPIYFFTKSCLNEWEAHLR